MIYTLSVRCNKDCWRQIRYRIHIYTKALFFLDSGLWLYQLYDSEPLLVDPVVQFGLQRGLQHQHQAKVWVLYLFVCLLIPLCYSGTKGNIGNIPRFYSNQHSCTLPLVISSSCWETGQSSVKQIFIVQAEIAKLIIFCLLVVYFWFVCLVGCFLFCFFC